eukprot:TRINITY_DN24349_c0_g3_i1.p1 TRINITY_DN24349_c0_g3~~TRINITY_DN24349_c0_g3_i1.p1  ORF type:complete len:1106 (+),score=202.69 TRINITY_DN24349_c0_g3_i1:256-3318(+)
MGAALRETMLGVKKTGNFITAVACGRYFGCALFDQFKVKCWGVDAPALGYGDSLARGTTAASMGDNLGYIPLTASVSQIAAGAYHVCAIFTDNSLRCWGSNTYGQLGYGHNSDIGTTPTDLSGLGTITVGGTPAAVECANYHSCILDTAGKVMCWGRNNDGQLGLEDTTARSTPSTAVDLGGERTSQFCAAAAHTCSLLVSGVVKCWGLNDRGQLGQGDTANRGQASNMGSSLQPIDLGLSGGVTVTKVACGGEHNCAVLSDGGLKCWGFNNFGQLGQGDKRTRGENSGQMGTNLPLVQLGDGYTVRDVALGSYQTCAVLNTYEIKCWGRGDFGQVGGENQVSPGEVAGQMGNNLAVVDTNQQCPDPTRSPSTAPSRQPSTPPSRQPSRQPSTPPSRQPSTPPSRQPSAQPSRQPSTSPSRQPSAPPSRSPTTAPSRSPSVPPSKPPSTAPSVPPSVAPSTLPSVSPTAAPSLLPSAGPSRGPFVQPSVSPSLRPSAAPSAAPSLPPTRAPSGVPSAPPSASPSVGPTRAPSRSPAPPTGPPAAPTRAPATAPSRHPSRRSAAPTAPPRPSSSGAPTRAAAPEGDGEGTDIPELPTQEVAEATGGGFSIAGPGLLAISGGGGVAGGHTATVPALIGAVKCDPNKNGNQTGPRSCSWVLNPGGLKVAGSCGAGAIVSNLAVVGGLGVIHVGVALFQYCRAGPFPQAPTRWQRAAARALFPSRGAAWLPVTAAGIVGGGAEAANDGQWWFSLLAAGVTLLYVSFIAATSSTALERAKVEMTTPVAGWRSFLFNPSVAWESLDGHFVERYGDFFNSYKPPYHRRLATVDAGIALPLAVVAGIQSLTGPARSAGLALACIVHLTVLRSVVQDRPYADGIENTIAALALCCECLVAVCGAIAHAAVEKDCRHWLHGLTALLSTIVGFVSLALYIRDMSECLRTFCAAPETEIRFSTPTFGDAGVVQGVAVQDEDGDHAPQRNPKPTLGPTPSNPPSSVPQPQAAAFPPLRSNRLQCPLLAAQSVC